MAGHVVLGMHRSGTSLLTSLLELAGCDLGPTGLRSAAGSDNPRGFHENRLVVELNTQVLAAAGDDWFDVVRIAEGGLALVDRAEFDRRATEALSWTVAGKPWLIKDPRLVPVFPLWRSFLDDPTAIIPVRDPAEVAHSLNLRNGMSLAVAAALWEFHVVRALEESRGLRRVLVLHHNLLADPVAEMRSLVAALDHPDVTMPSHASIHARIDVDLHRQRRTNFGEPAFLRPSQRALFEMLSTCEDVDQLPTLEVSSESMELLESNRSPRRPRPLRHPTPDSGVRRRTAVVVQGCRLPVFEASLRAIRETWAATNRSDVDVFFAYGNGCDDHELMPLRSQSGEAVQPVPDGEVVADGDLLLLGCSDLIFHQSDSLLRKRLSSLQYLLNTDSHDAFLLVCASSYVDLDVLAKHVSTLDLGMRLQGPTFIAENGRVVVSGSAMLLSRDLAQRLVEDSAELLTAAGYQYPDDVSISDWVASHISDTDSLAMAERVRAGMPATTDNTFCQPPIAMLNYVEMEEGHHVKVDGAYHYHFSTDKPSEMRRFHDRWYDPKPMRPNEEATIFVQIASYRDRELPRTIASALDRAEHPERLRFGICWQYDENTYDDLEPWADDDRFRIDEVYYRKSDGCTWARNRANSMFAGEDYYLQIDAHMRFVDGWDVRLIEMLNGIDAEKPVLTVYPHGYTTDGNGNDELAEISSVHVLALASINKHLQTRQSTRIAPDQNAPGKSPLIAAGFLFARGSFCEEVSYDPFGYFVGEEIALAARAYSWGYDFFYPCEPIVWHRYDHDEPLHWADNADAMSASEERSRARLATLLVGDHRELGSYGLGPIRTIAAFEQYCGIDFAAAARGERLSTPTEMELEIDLDTDGIDLNEDYEVWVFAVLGTDERELLRRDIDDEDILRGMSKRLSFTASFNVVPTKYLLWPKSRTSGFGERRIRDIETAPIPANT